ncbi:MAG: calcium-binding protein [Gemmataceae bacterium]
MIAKTHYSNGGIYTVTVQLIDDDTGEAETFKTEIFVTGVRLYRDTGELQVVGTADNDEVDIDLVNANNDDDDDDDDDDQRTKPQIRVTTDFDEADQINFNPDDVKTIRMALGDGDDLAIIGTSGNDNWYTESLIEGDKGRDTLIGGGGQDTLLGGEDKDKLKGRRGDDVLSGGDGNDTLDGGSGDDVLIGGDGKDGLRGRSGDDLLLAAMWSDESNIAALNAVHAEWTRDDATYEQKRDHLTGANPGGLNSPFVLDSTTITEDEDQDTLSGNGGRDLFFAQMGGTNTDRVRGLRGNEDLLPIV